MRLAHLVVAVLGWSLVSSHAHAQGVPAPEPVSGFFGVLDVTPELGPSLPRGTHTPSAVTVAYDNTASTANFAVSSTDLTADWGDRLVMTVPGVLSAQRFTLFNSGSSAGSLLSAQVQVDFFDFGTSAFLGGYTTQVTFGAGLAAGFYAILNVNSLEPLLINLPADVLVTQSVVSSSGTANRLGIASLEPVTVGSSPTTMYIFASTIAGGAPGFYTFMNGPANPGYQLELAQPPVGTTTSTWGKVKQLYR